MALGGLLTALAVTFMLLGGILPLAAYCGPVLAMAALLPVQEEAGHRAAAAAYGAAALLGLLLSADRECALVYLCFGWYPLLRPRIAALPSRLGRLAARLAVCGGALLVLGTLALRLLGPAAVPGPPLLQGALLVLGCVTFLLLDRALERLTALWRRSLRKRLFRP